MTSKKTRFSREYMLDRASTRSIWNQISTSMGLSEWFAPKVVVNETELTVYWDNEGDERIGEITESDKDHLITWRWRDEPRSYITLEIVKTALTSTVSLLVTDHDIDMEEETLSSLWEQHIDNLRRSLGLD